MNTQPDHLFRSRLEHFHMPAPARAWDRVERNLEKRSRFVWLKVAASIVMVVTAALWVLTPASTTKTLTVENPTTSKGTSTPAVQVPQPHVTMQPQTVQAVNKNNEPRTITTSAEPIPVRQEVVALEPEKTEPITETLVVVSDQPETAVAESVTSTVIVYTAAEVNSKYLLKKSGPEATPEMKKTSRFQMLAGLAYNITSGESSLGDLRDKKNEILALNFLDNKKPGTQAGKEKKN